MEIKVKIKNVYGAERVYPVCSKAQLFANIADTKTLGAWTIKQIKELGYKVLVVNEITEL